MRTRVMNQLHVVALNEGLRRKKALWRPAGRVELEGLSLATWASRRRQDLLDLLDQLTPKIHELNGKLEQIVERRPVTRRLSTHPGVGPLTALAFELVIGTPERFACGKQIASYVGLIPAEESSGDRRRLGHISASRATRCCASCWWQQPRSRCAAMGNGAACSFLWPCGADARSRKSRWPGSWRSSCTGCGGAVGTTNRCSSSVRTRESRHCSSCGPTHQTCKPKDWWPTVFDCRPPKCSNFSTR